MDYEHESNYDYDSEQNSARSVTASELRIDALGDVVVAQAHAVSELAHDAVDWIKHGVEVLTSKRSHS